MPRETTRLREMTLRYAVKQDADGEPILVDHALGSAARCRATTDATASGRGVRSVRHPSSLDASPRARGTTK